MSSIIYNTILVNNKQYFYYNKIKDILNAGCITNYKNIDRYFVKSYDNISKFYISSKTKYANKWLLLKENYKIVSTWINFSTQKEMLSIKMRQELCDQIFTDISNCDNLIFYTNESNKSHYGSIIEIGIAISLNKKIYICGNNIYNGEVLFNFKESVDYTYSNLFNVKKILYKIN